MSIDLANEKERRFVRGVIVGRVLARMDVNDEVLDAAVEELDAVLERLGRATVIERPGLGLVVHTSPGTPEQEEADNRMRAAIAKALGRDDT